VSVAALLIVLVAANVAEAVPRGPLLSDTIALDVPANPVRVVGGDLNAATAGPIWH